MGDYYEDFGNVATTWFERNILLQIVIRPRKHFLEISRPSGRSIRSAKTSPRPRSGPTLEIIVADPEFARGLAGLALGGHYSAPSASRRTRTCRLCRRHGSPPIANGRSIRSSRRLVREEVRQKINRNTLSQLESVIERLGGITAAQLSISRKLRKLEIPDEVTVFYKGESIRSEMTLKKKGKTSIRNCSPTYASRSVTTHCRRLLHGDRQIDVVPPRPAQLLARKRSPPTLPSPIRICRPPWN